MVFLMSSINWKYRPLRCWLSISFYKEKQVNEILISEKKKEKRNDMRKGNVVNRCHRFFYFNVICRTSINFCVLMAAIQDSASVFGLIIAVFFSIHIKPFSRLNVACL